MTVRLVAQGGLRNPPIRSILPLLKRNQLMRKIETEMNAAISEQREWQKDNTMVTHADGITFVFLHGNCIAQLGDFFIRLFDGGFQTKTTKSRLNAILSAHGESGDRVFQKKGEWFVTMNTVQGLSTIPFWNSMRLG